MKIKHLLTTLVTALAGLACHPQAAQAQTPLTYNPADVFLGFRATGGTGVSSCYLVNLGQASQFTGASGAFTVPNLGNIAADLTATFGANWNTRSDVLWSVSGAIGNFAAVGSDPLKTLYASREETTPGTPSDGWNRGSSTAQGSTTTKMAAMGNAFVQFGSTPNDSTTNSPVGLIQNDSDSNSYASYMPGGTTANSGPAPGISFATYSPTIEGTFTNGTAGSALDFVRLLPGSGAGTIIGTFTINNSGVLTFTPAGAVPTANVHFTTATYAGSEADGTIAIGITRDGDTSGTATVNLSTADGTALAGTDYTALVNTPVTFGAGVATQSVSVAVVHRTGFQGDRNFTVSLANPGAATTITTPSTATVTIHDADPAPAGAIAFSVASEQVNALTGAGTPNTVTLNLTRTNGTTGAVTVDVSVTNSSLVNGTDYTFTSPTTVSFADGVATGSVNVPLKTILPGSLPGTITLGLSNPTNSATLGAITSNTVTVVAPGALAFSAPNFKFAPVDNHGNPSDPSITLTRTNGVNGPVSVSVSVSGGTLVNGTDYTFTNPTTVNFADGSASASFDLPLKAIATAKLPGTVIFNLTNAAGGASLGAQTTATVTITKRDLILPTLAATTPAVGAIVTTPFTLTGKALDAAGIDHVEVTLNGGAVQLATLGAFANGKVSYTLAGLTPENGKNTLVITAVDSSGNRSMPLTLSVKYLNNRPAFAGSYTGLLVPTGTPSISTSGFLKLTVTATGTFTGSAALGGFTLPFTGVFGNDGTAHFKPSLATSLALTGPAQPPVALGSLALAIATDVNLDAVVTGTLQSAPGTTVATISAARTYFNGLTPATTVDTRYTLANKGAFTLVFPSQAEGVLPTTSFPQGDGYANLTLTSAGAISIVGKLADGTPLSASAHLAKDYSWPFFAALFAGKGSLAGPANFDDTRTNTDVKGQGLLWLRPAKPTSKYYPAGWPAGLQIDLDGAKYIKPVGASVLPNLGAVDPVNGNATLVFADGKLTGPQTKTVNITTANVVTNVPATDKTFTLALAKGTGLISGTFKHTDLTKPAYGGIIFQKGINAGAYGFFLSTVPATPGATGESGGVSLNAK